MPFMSDIYDNYGDCSDRHSNLYYYFYETVFDRYDSNLIYNGIRYNIGAINLDYTYRVSKRLAFGATLTFNAEFQKTYDISNDNLIFNRRSYHLGIAPTMRLYWIDKEMVRFYSAASLGVGYIMNRGSKKSNSTIFNGQLTYAGVSVGKRLHGYSELSVGTMGIFRVGIGYKF